MNGAWLPADFHFLRPWALWGLSLSGGPNMARHFHQKRFTASCTMAFCASLPFIMTSRAS